MPQIIIKTGLFDQEGREEQLSEYICDIAGCPNVATNVLGQVRELGAAFAVCHVHTSPPPVEECIHHDGGPRA